MKIILFLVPLGDKECCQQSDSSEFIPPYNIGTPTRKHKGHSFPKIIITKQHQSYPNSINSSGSINTISPKCV